MNASLGNLFTLVITAMTLSPVATFAFSPTTCNELVSKNINCKRQFATCDSVSDTVQKETCQLNAQRYLELCQTSSANLSAALNSCLSQSGHEVGTWVSGPIETPQASCYPHCAASSVATFSYTIKTPQDGRYYVNPAVVFQDRSCVFDHIDVRPGHDQNTYSVMARVQSEPCHFSVKFEVLSR